MIQLTNDYNREVFNGDVGFITKIDTEEQEDCCQGHRAQTTTKNTSQTEPVKREEWEKQMLKLAIACLKDNPANAGEEMQTATFGNGKYRVIYHTPSEMLQLRFAT